METGFYTQRHAEINGRGVWLYLISCPIGNIFVVEYEKDKTMELNRIIIDANYDEADKKFEKVCTKMLKGKL